MPADADTQLILRALDDQRTLFKTRMDAQDSTLARVEKKLDNHETRIDVLEGERDIHKGRTDWMKYVPPGVAACLGGSVGLLALVLK